MGQKTVRPPLGLIADDTALDFVNSIAAPRGTEHDWVSDGEDLLHWLTAANLISIGDADGLRQHLEKPALDDAALKARELREWFRSFVLRRAGTTQHCVATADAARLNEILAHGSSFMELEAAAGQSPQLKQRRRWSDKDMLLVPVAEAMARLIESVNFSEVKNCEGPTCTMLFRDVSKNHKRRWCSMAVCGNRAKAAAHREKKRVEAPG